MLFRDDLSLKGRRGQEKGEEEGRREGEREERERRSLKPWSYKYLVRILLYKDA